MKASCYLNPAPPLHPVLGIVLFNFVCLFLLFIVFFSFFAHPADFEIRMPAASSMAGEGHVTIRITSENVLYFNKRVVTINDLKRVLLKLAGVNAVIYLDVDRRASMGRVADVWDMCNGLGLAKVRIVASENN